MDYFKISAEDLAVSREKNNVCKHAEIINRDKILELLVDKQLAADGMVHLRLRVEKMVSM